MRKVGFEWSSRKVYRSQLVANYSSLTWLFFPLVQQSFRGSHFRGTKLARLKSASTDLFFWIAGSYWSVCIAIIDSKQLFSSFFPFYGRHATLSNKSSFDCSKFVSNIKINSRSSLYNSRTNTVDFIEIIQTIYIEVVQIITDGFLAFSYKYKSLGIARNRRDIFLCDKTVTSNQKSHVVEYAAHVYSDLARFPVTKLTDFSQKRCAENRRSPAKHPRRSSSRWNAH